jgi:hypothetical protein
MKCLAVVVAAAAAVAVVPPPSPLRFVSGVFFVFLAMKL